jgi:hypothetical protein
MAKMIIHAFESLSEVLNCTVCRDGWFSRSRGRGTCSWHKGIFRIFH